MVWCSTFTICFPEFATCMLSWTITQPIELTITRFPGLFHFNPTHKLSRNSMKKTSKENPRSQYFYDSSSSSLLSTHVLITLFGSPSPNLVVLLNVTKLWGVGLVKLSYNVNLCSCEARHPFQWFPAAITRLFHTCGWSGVTWKIQHPAIQGAFPSAYKRSHHGMGLHCSLLCCAQMYDIP